MSLLREGQRGAARHAMGVWALWGLCLLWLGGALNGVWAAETPGRKFALVIGNGAYAPVVALKNPVRDADLISGTLSRLGFSVTLLKDRTQKQLDQDIEDFKRRATGAELVMLYYAGHGLEIDGQNYLIPVDQFPGQIQGVSLKATGLSINYLQRLLSDDGRTRVTVMVMDACRTLPRGGAGQQGFAEATPARGVLQLYSTAPSKPAADGQGNNSPFASIFNRHLQNTQLSLKEVVELTQADMDRETQGAQRPWVVSGLAGDLKLVGNAPASATAGAPGKRMSETVALAGAPSGSARRGGGGPPDSPFLRLDAGAHLGPIWALDTDVRGEWLATAGDDKTVRIWQLPEGRLVNTLRPPLADGPEARLLAVAMSPDASLVATGGFTGLSWDGSASVYLYNRRQGEIRRRLTGLPGLVAQLAFSPDGQRLAVGLSSRQFQVWVYDLRSEAEPQVLSAEAAGGRPSVSTAVAWASDGRLAMAGSDGQLYVFGTQPGSWRLNLRPLVQQPLSAGPLAPKALVFSPDGRSLALSYSPAPDAPSPGNGPVVEVRDAQTLQPRLGLDTQGLVNRFPADTPRLDLGALAQWAALDRVAWSADGQQLLGVGQWSVDGRTQARVWSAQSGQVLRNVATGPNTALAVRQLPQGGWVLGFGDGAWGRLTPDGRWQAVSISPSADLRGSCCQGALRLDPTAQVLQFGLASWGRQPQVFDLRQREWRAGTLAQGLLPLQNQLGVEGWMNTALPKLNGRPLMLNVNGSPQPLNEPTQSLAELPDRSGFVLGTQIGLHRFDRQGQAQWRVPLPAIAWGLNIDRSGRLVVAALGDGSLRWYRLSDGHELLALYAHADRKRWVLWTPSGYYDASAGGESLAGWHLNRSAADNSDFFPLNQFRERFFRPDVIDQVLNTLDEDLALAQANASAQREEERRRADEFLPPVLEAIDAPDSFASPVLDLRLRVRSASDAPLRRLRLWINGRVPAAADWQQQTGPDGELRLRLLRLPSQDSVLRVLADNRHGSSLPLQIPLHWASAAGPATRTAGLNARATATATATATASSSNELPRLWLLSVGVSRFADPAMPALRYAHLDAQAFADTLRQQQGRAYREVGTRVLTDQQADRDSILAGLQWLQAQMTEGDVGMVFLAGHGFTLGADHRYYYGSHDAVLEHLPETGVPYKAIQDTLVALNLRGGGSRAVFFIDTCHAGQAPLPVRANAVRLSNGDAMAQELSRPESQVLVFASSRGDQLSWEYPDAGHGAYTAALLEGLDKRWKADPYGQGQVTYKGLDAWVSVRVPALTKGQQTPRLITPAGGLDDFALARRNAP